MVAGLVPGSVLNTAIPLQFAEYYFLSDINRQYTLFSP